MVTTSFGDFSIVRQTDRSVDFTAHSEDGKKVWHGGVDRLSGHTIVTGYLGQKPVENFDLTCKRANPLF